MKRSTSKLGLAVTMSCRKVLLFSLLLSDVIKTKELFVIKHLPELFKLSICNLARAQHVWISQGSRFILCHDEGDEDCKLGKKPLTGLGGGFYIFVDQSDLQQVVQVGCGLVNCRVHVCRQSE